MQRSVLIVDDDTSIRASLSQALADPRTEVSSAENAEAAIAVLAEQPTSVALVDLKMPGMGGMELLRLLRERSPDVDVIIMTAYDDLPTVATAMSEGAVDFLVKPLDLHHLRRVLDRLFEDREVRLRAAVGGTEQAEKTDGLVGRDPHMVEIFKVVGRVATNRTNVVIRGESGTGKELIAREIHASSPYSDEPFVAVNCTALPATLLESELFGHVRGAFTGASSDRRGRFSLAGRGTIFLDEIGDTALEFQAKLLRVLQEHEYYPVGAEQAERTEARVIAATHRDLEAMLGAGRFREDLYYRLRVVEITIPPLRDRMEDVTRLAENLVAKAATAVGKDAPVITPPAIEALISYSWPGNVRELENCLIRAVVMATGDVIHPEHLRLEGRSPHPAGLTTLEEVEKEHLVRVLTATRGHKSRSAEILGVSRPRLDRLIHKLELVELLERLRRGEEPRSQTDRD